MKIGAFPKGKQHGKIDTILRIHKEGYPRNCATAMILGIITPHYLSFAMLFMQLRGSLSRAFTAQPVPRSLRGYAQDARNAKKGSF